MPEIRYVIDRTLWQDAVDHLDHIACGGLPSPETAAKLARRFREIARNGGFQVADPSQPASDLYKDAPPP